jgi:cytochrome c oxidase subunit 3
MVMLAWLIWRGARGDFSSDYFTPVDVGGLYWHIVDLVWIFLVPLFYLIH